MLATIASYWVTWLIAVYVLAGIYGLITKSFKKD